MNIVAINYSMSSTNPTPIGSEWSNEREELFQEAYEAGILIVASAGNKKKNVVDVSPANLDVPIVVSSVTLMPHGEYMFSEHFSNYGDTIDFAALGDNVRVAKMGTNTYESGWYGTSFSAPHIAANIATLYNECETCTPKTIERVLRMSAKDYGDKGKDDYYGNGIIDIELAKKTIKKYESKKGK